MAPQWEYYLHMTFMSHNTRNQQMICVHPTQPPWMPCYRKLWSFTTINILPMHLYTHAHPDKLLTSYYNHGAISRVQSKNKHGLEPNTATTDIEAFFDAARSQQCTLTIGTVWLIVTRPSKHCQIQPPLQSSKVVYTWNVMEMLLAKAQLQNHIIILYIRHSVSEQCSCCDQPIVLVHVMGT